MAQKRMETQKEQPRKMSSQEFLTYILEAKSKGTWKNYRNGLRRFSEWYGKTPDEILEERFRDLQSPDTTTRKRFNREIEKFHRNLKNQGLTQNSAVAYTEGIRQLFRYFDMDIKDLPTEVTRKIITTKDYVPSVGQYRDMYNCGSLKDRLIISLGLDLAWRIGDVLNILKDTLPDLEATPPIPFDLITQKEEVISKSFLSGQTVTLLQTYLKTIAGKQNPYLLASNGKSHLDAESINKRLKVLAKKAGVKIPKGKRLRFHCFRKRFLSECANLKIDINTAKTLCGKSVKKDMLSYLGEVKHEEAFKEVHEKLRMTVEPQLKEVVTVKEEQIKALERRIEELEILNRGLIEMLKTTPKEEVPFKAEIETIREFGRKAQQRDQEEYKKLIENNNNHNRKT